ncbi:LysR family transcriptional regulator [Nitrospirillum viridazoti]|uniref:LysR family transcriptional regulator n=1 Tax=Nitrospirillum amazonense TaxID=28077 RepID=A0A560I6Z0_9PROT|nr:LysR family transcriptional regulator [Nitrospirillum amazonense]TWB52914.1 LysR family transcriptional regulator [Nitrospirillum amazonense]
MHQIDLSRVDLNLLVVFEALAAERHVGRAAERLRLSQSATSHALGRLRRLFDDPLFVRHAAGVEPTPRARALAESLAAALAQIRALVSPTHFDPAKLERVIKVATHEYVAAVLMPELLSLLRREATGVDVRCVSLSYRDIISAFERGEIDLACGAFPGLYGGRLERTPLFEDHFAGVARAEHPAVAEGRMELEAFASSLHVWVGFGREPYDPVADALAARGRTRRIAMAVTNALAVPSLIAGSDLVGVIPRRLAVRMCKSPQFSVFELPVAIEPMTCDVLMPTALAETPEAQWFKRIFANAAAKIALA